MNELITMLDPTLGVWKNDLGYFWYDKFDGTRSEGYFETEREAVKNCKELIYKLIK
jgi:hypothetical protein